MVWKKKAVIQEEQAIPGTDIGEALDLPPLPRPPAPQRQVQRPMVAKQIVKQDLWVLEETPTQVVQTIKNSSTGEEISIQEALVRILNILEE